MSHALQFRPEAADSDAIRLVHEKAFGQAAEADLVDRLRADGDLVLSLVAAAPGVIGHVAFSRLSAVDSRLRAVALAPVAVPPERQNQGIGTALIREGLRVLGAGGEDLVLVLGEPSYYGRFGFIAEAANRLITPYDGPFLQALVFTEAGREARGEIRYAPAFADLG